MLCRDVTMKWFEHAFAVDPPGPAQPNEGQRLVIDRLCREIVRRGLTTPARMALEMGLPLNYLSAQALHFFHPFVMTIADAGAYEQFTLFLEQRGAVDYIAGRLEAIAAEHDRAENPPDGAS
jgi:hypothetical protein